MGTSLPSPCRKTEGFPRRGKKNKELIDIETVIKIAQEQGMKLLGGIAIVIVGFFLIHWLMKILTRNDRLERIEPTIRGFILKLVKVMLYILVILTAANVMGVPMTSLVTLLGSAGVAVSLAMQGALSNLVGGLTLLLLKPFKANEYVKVGETEGTVRSIGTFFTEFTTPDNRHISLPNSSLTNTAIVNYSREGTRRLDVTFSVSYDADIDRTVSTLMEAVKLTDGILEDPAPMVKLSECGESGMKFVIRVWCMGSDYWNVNWDLIERGKRLLDQAGIQIPYPQMDVHVK